ncbi:MAG: 16S rRNA (cytidine(1402)-2'-O)-methyltransferase [Eubacteriales bacterium]|nr:16S rRNA (cytidine(1402)-2'-O)-methyltransferase [Eubacteriales bacterium]
MDTEAGKLYIVATPIGNLSDMSPRAVETLRSVDLIAAEDTRNTIHLLTHFDIRTPMESYHEFNKYDKADDLVNRMLSGKNVAIVTDAGTPCISDPGEVLVAKCAEAGITVTGIPGPSAVINALTLSGLSTRRFTFEGFLPAKKQKKERAAALERLKKETVTIIVYEAPHHLTETLKDLSEALGADRRVALCREMTKIHEEVIRTTLSEAVETVPRGEYVLVIEGKDEKEAAAERTAEFSELSIEEHMQRYLEKGVEKKEAMKLVAADRGVTKRDIYKYLAEKE